MNNIYKYGFALLAACVSAGALTSCDDWTEQESIDLVYNTPDKANPAQYAKYLEGIRQYRQTDHKLTYVWFNNPAGDQVTNTRAERVMALPDSVDFVVFNNPASLTETTISDMKEAREKKGMKFSYVIDFDAIKLIYLNHVATSTEENPFDVDFLDFVTDSVSATLAYAKKNGFDGIMIGYNGKNTSHLTAAELTEYKTQENVFIGIMSDWHARNPEMLIDFIGKPQNVANKDLVNDCHVIFLSESQSANSTYGFGMAVAMASVEGVPTDRFGVVTTYLDPSDEKIGHMADGSLCVTSLANWASGENVKAAGFTNTVYDYYNVAKPYPVLREAIQILNPSNL